MGSAPGPATGERGLTYAVETSARRGHLLDLDPDLGESLDAERRELARRHLTVRLARVDVGEWNTTVDALGSPAGLGLLIVEGLAIRRVSLGHRAAAELLGSGDILRPWEDDGEHVAYPFSAGFRIVSALTFAVLDEEATHKLMHFPEIVSELMGRVMSRSRRVAGHLVIAQLASVDMRLHVALWHVADRFGKVSSEGVIVPLTLTHEALGLIVGARRPSVTAALGRLAARELVVRHDEGGWLLRGDAPQLLTASPTAAD